MSERKISAAGVSEDPQGNDRILTQRLATNPVTTWTKVYNFVKGLLDTAYSSVFLKIDQSTQQTLMQGNLPLSMGIHII